MFFSVRDLKNSGCPKHLPPLPHRWLGTAFYTHPVNITMICVWLFYSHYYSCFRFSFFKVENCMKQCNTICFFGDDSEGYKFLLDAINHLMPINGIKFVLKVKLSFGFGIAKYWLSLHVCITEICSQFYWNEGIMSIILK